MSEAEGEPPRHFSFAFAETDLWAYRLLLAARRPRSSGAGFFFGAILSPIGAGLCVLAAFKLGLFPRAAFGPVLFATLIAFVAGAVAYHAISRVQQRRVARSDFAASRSANERRNFTFDEDGIVSTTSATTKSAPSPASNPEATAAPVANAPSIMASLRAP